MDYCYQPYRASFWIQGLRAYEIQLDELETLPVWHGIYFLCKREGILYVGKSQIRDDGIKGRIREHWQHSNKTFSYVIILSLLREKVLIEQWEKAAILTFNPEINKKDRNPSKPILNDILGIHQFIKKMGAEQIRGIARIGINSWYDPEQAELNEPYRGVR